jgi:hypothetical protein
MSNTPDIIGDARAGFLRSKDSLRQALTATPDDRLNWSPAPTARTPIQQVAHSAQSIRCIHDFLDGRPFPITNTKEADAFFRESESKFTTREQVLAHLEEASAAYVAWLDALTPERLAAMAELPFGMGQMPVAAGLGIPSDHTDWHRAQLEYMQTIYGDRDWGM